MKKRKRNYQTMEERLEYEMHRYERLAEKTRCLSARFKALEVRLLRQGTKECAGPPKALAAIQGLREFQALNGPAVYFLVQGNEVVYIGQSRNLASRLQSHSRRTPFDQAYFLPVGDTNQLTVVEMGYIKAMKPVLNRTGNAK